MGFGDWCAQVGKDFYDGVVTKFGGQTLEQQRAEQTAAGAQQRGQSLRSQLTADERGLDAGAGVDPTSITQHENWRSFSHQRIYDTNQTLSQNRATEIVNAWRQIGDALNQLGSQLRRDASAAINGGWRGEAADAANKTGEPLIAWMQHGAQASHLTGDKIEEAATAAGQVKGMVPPPQGFNLGRTIAASIPLGLTGLGPIPGGIDAVQQMQEQQQAERAAQDTMARVYTPTYSNVDASVPTYQNLDASPAPAATPPPPPPPASAPAPVRSGGIGGGGAGRGGASGSVHSGGSLSDAPGSRAGATPGVLDSPPGDPGSVGSQSAAPVAAGSGPALPGAGGGGGGGGAGIGGIAGGFGTGRLGAGRVGAGSGRAGSVTGRTGVKAGGRSGSRGSGAAQDEEGTSGGADASGRPGASGTPGMGGVGRGRGGSGDHEHERPTWLEENDDIWFDEMPRTAPPVFGV